jgi:hypothetical protein
MNTPSNSEQADFACEQCKQPVAVAVAIVVAKPGSFEVRFCSPVCATLWLNVEAGEPLMPDLDSPFFRSGNWMGAL